jgi:hypothetical protein
MEDIDIEKIKELLDVVRESGCAVFQYKDIVMQFSEVVYTDARGTEVAPTDDGEVVEQKSVLPHKKPIGYTAIFGSRAPSFKRPGSP